MQNLVLTRIDDRLIHGQVMTAWIRNRKADQVVIVDDGTANDEYMIEVLEMAIPEEIAIGIFTKEEGVQFFEQGLDAPTILLVKGPEALNYLVDHALPLRKWMSEAWVPELIEVCCIRISQQVLRKIRRSLNYWRRM